MTRSGEDYLEAILILKNKNGYARALDVAEFLGVSKPSVTNAVKLLENGGFVTRDENKLLRLTEVGREVAERVYERHCVLTEILTTAGIDPETAEGDACKIEHDISKESFQRLKEFWEKKVKGKG